MCFLFHCVLGLLAEYMNFLLCIIWHLFWKCSIFFCIPADGYSHSIMISALCRSELFEEAKQLARDFEATYNKYDLVIMNSMLCAYCRAGEMESVMKLMRKMDELAISPDRNTFHILIKYFCKEKLYLLAYRTVEDMHKKGHQVGEVRLTNYHLFPNLICHFIISH